MNEFESLYAQHAGAVLRYARRCVGREDVAEEIASEAFLELYRNREQIRVDQLPAWLFTVVRNRAVDYWRRDCLEKRYLEEKPREPVVHPQEPGGILELVGAMRPSHAACLLLRYVHELSRAEIAEATGMTEIQVKNCLQYARELLRRRLNGETVEEMVPE